MPSPTLPAFALPDSRAAKADPFLIGGDEQHFADIAATLDASITELTGRLAVLRSSPGGTGRAAMDRDMEIHRLTARLRTLRRYGIDLCLGHMVAEDDPQPVYIGRLGLTDESGRTLLLDWRAPAAEPFFGATHARPMGLARRRRFRWELGQVTDYWDEVFLADGAGRGHPEPALDDQSAFIASLGADRSPRMRDVLGTIAADQDAIIRAGSRGALVVDGGPGTGKTVVALHRTAYLLYSDPRLGHHRGGVLFVGPHDPYLAYIGDVLPSLGEEGVQTATLRDLVAEGADAEVESDPVAVAVKSSLPMLDAVESAVAFYEEPPTVAMTVETEWADVRLRASDWAAAFDAVERGTPHNEAHDSIWDALVDIVGAAVDDVPPAEVRKSLQRNRDLASALVRAWPMIEAADLVGDLWSVPAYLRACAPWLGAQELAAVRRTAGGPWTDADLPLLDAARRRLGDPEASRRRLSQRGAIEAERARRAAVVDDLIAADSADTNGGDSDGDGDSTSLVTMLRGGHLHEVLIDEAARPTAEPDRLAGPFAHIVVDEAQELTDAQWRMLVSRCPSGSFTIVGDRAQARGGFAESWERRLGRIGLDRVESASLRINYRTPGEVMDLAAPTILAVLPDANVPTSIRRNGIAVDHRPRRDVSAIIDAWLAEHEAGVACVIGDPTFPGTARVRSLPPELVKGLEFDLVVLVEPESFGDGITGAVDRYVSMTRATQRLVIVSGEP
ncbi:AAA family ATPase [Williamsia sp. Leaf354]|uniref:RNA polymerase recycling motor ATPase HelR n=1 Tax=Williamsia sp. Leaf354 TaxID=1736349 RepID=UPI0006F7E324|nr:RNA polymerase recycling motor ATPase HelR [Williamsia sp. Leaf354]KQR96167.1 AAA family ATPase [Williamsia sp. Leaf354]